MKYLQCFIILSFIILALSNGENHPNEHSGVLIFGGKEVRKGKYTHLVGLRVSKGSESICGGTVISSTHVITAAHCKLNTINVVAIGMHHRMGNAEGIEIMVKKVTVHPNFKLVDYRLENDVGIIELAEPIPSSMKIVPTVLASMDGKDELPGMVANVHGWGKMQNEERSLVRMEVDVIIMSNDVCLSKLRQTNPYANLKDDSICAGGAYGEDACEGDSGGPLVVHKEDNPPTLIGVVSWGYDCGLRDHPGVYSRISFAKAFIDENSVGHVWK